MSQSALVFCSHDICTDDSYAPASDVGQVRQGYCLYLSPSTYTHCTLSLHTPHPPHTHHTLLHTHTHTHTHTQKGWYYCKLVHRWCSWSMRSASSVHCIQGIYESIPSSIHTHIPPKLHTLHIHPYFCA